MRAIDRLINQIRKAILNEERVRRERRLSPHCGDNWSLSSGVGLGDGVFSE